MTYRHYEENLKSTLKIILQRFEAEGLAGYLKPDEIDAMLRYLFNDRRIADQKEINRLVLAKTYWRFMTRLAKEGRLNRSALDIALKRTVQSGLWPNGTQELGARTAFFLEILKNNSGGMVRLFIQLPYYFIKRISIWARP